jgi:2-polyprenyl-3-methyl-5-hydroxy-6-metoxy-1,4-benzoquinol methylase
MPVYTPDKYEHSARDPHSYTVYGEGLIGFLPAPLAGKRILDVGCGNGFWAQKVKSLGADVIGIDGSTKGIALARELRKGIRFEQMLAIDTVLEDLGEEPFDAVLSVEVVEHVFDPRGFVKACAGALKPGGTLVLTTPYHGYLKNVALSVAGKWDFHHNPLWDGGHIKFWSRNTLGKLLTEMGFVDLRFGGFGRMPYLWMGMVMSGRKPGG